MKFNNFINDLLFYNKCFFITPFSHRVSTDLEEYVKFSRCSLVINYVIVILFFVTTCYETQQSLIEGIMHKLVSGEHKTVDFAGVVNMMGNSLVTFFCVIQQLKNCDKQIDLFNCFKKIDEKLKLENLYYKELKFFYKIRFYLIVFYNLIIVNGFFWISQNKINNSDGIFIAFLYSMQSTTLGVIGNFISTILLMIFLRFKIINKKLKCLKNLEELRKIFEINENLCDLIRKFSKLFGLTFVAILCNSLFLTAYTFFSVYWGITEPLMKYEVIIFHMLGNLLWVLPYTFEIFVLGIISHLTTTEVSI